MPQIGLYREGLERFGPYWENAVNYNVSRALGDGGSTRENRFRVAGKTVIIHKANSGYAELQAYLVAAGYSPHYGTDMGISRALKDALEENLTSWELKFYIQDKNSNWVDFTDRANWRGKNQLRKVGSITYSGERGYGGLTQKVNEVVLDNTDGFWDKPFPTTLKASMDSQKRQLSSDTTASFDTSTGGLESSIYRKKACIRAHFQTINTDVPSVVTIGTFLVDEMMTDSTDQSATLRLMPLSDPLIESNAETVKSGGNFYANRSVKFLVQELLKKSGYKDTSSDGAGQVPVDYDIDDIGSLSVPFTGTSRWISSSFGRPPENTLRNGATRTTWEDTTGICKAMCMWEYTTGTVSLTPGSAIITGSSTSWSTSGGNGLRVGDAFVVQASFSTGDGGVTTIDHFKAQVLTVDSTTQITLDRPVTGTVVESSIKYSIQRIYMGVGPSLYEYNVASDSYVELTTSNALIGTSYHIKKIWFNTADTTYPIWGVALSNISDTEYTQSMKIFRFRWNSNVADVDIWGPSSSDPFTTGVYSGEFSHRLGRRENFVTAGTQVRIIGAPNGTHVNDEQAPLYSPYSQTIVNASTAGAGRDIRVYDQAGWDDAAVSGDADDYYERAKSVKVNTGWYGIADENIVLDDSIEYLVARHSYGQTGAITFVPGYGTKGAIFFPKYYTVYVTGAAGTSHYLSHRYYFIDLAQTEGSAVISSYMVDGTGHLATYAAYEPMATCVVGSSVYLCVHGFNNTTSRTNPSAILKIAALSTTPTVTRTYYETTSQSRLFTEIVGTSSYLFVAGIDLDSLTEASMSTAQFAKLWVLDATATVDATITEKTSSRYLFEGLSILDLNTSGSATYKCFYLQGSQGCIKYVNHSTAASETPTIAYPRPAISADGHCMVGTMIKSNNSKELYWISAPVPQQNTSGSDISGKFYLSKWSTSYAVRVELADFTGINCFDGIRYCSDLADARFGFTPEATFYFKSRPKSQTSAYTLTNIGQNRLVSMSKSRGQDQIINYSTRTPSRVTLGDISVGVELTPNSKYSKDETTYEFAATQTNLRARSIRLVCVVPGPPIIGDVAGCRFKYNVIRKTIETQITQTYNANDKWFYVDDGTDVVYGTIAKINGIDVNGNEITSTGKVGFSATVTGGFPVVVNAFGVNESIITTSETVDSGLENGYSLQIGDILLIANMSLESSWEYVQVYQINSDNVYVNRGVVDDYPAIDHDDGEQVFLIRNGNQLFTDVNNTLDTDSGYSIGDSIALDHPKSNVWSDQYVKDDNDSTPESSTTTDLWKPLSLGTFYPIGANGSATGVNLKLSYDSEVASEWPQFSIGDIIRIDAPGLVLSQDPGSGQIAKDAASINRWQKRENQDNNPFMNYLQAQWAALRDIQEYAEPRYTLNVQSILVPWLNPLDIVEVQDELMFPASFGRKEFCWISSMTFDLSVAGAMQLTLRGVNNF